MRFQAPEAEDEVQRGLLLNVVVRESTTVLQLLASKDEALLVWRDPFLVLDLRLDVINGVRRLDVQRDGLPRQRLHEDLHTAPEAEDEVQRGLLLNVVVRESTTVLQLLASKDEALLVWRDP